MGLEVRCPQSFSYIVISLALLFPNVVLSHCQHFMMTVKYTYVGEKAHNWLHIIYIYDLTVHMSGSKHEICVPLMLKISRFVSLQLINVYVAVSNSVVRQLKWFSVTLWTLWDRVIIFTPYHKPEKQLVSKF